MMFELFLIHKNTDDRIEIILDLILWELKKRRKFYTPNSSVPRKFLDNKSFFFFFFSAASFSFGGARKVKHTS